MTQGMYAMMAADTVLRPSAGAKPGLLVLYHGAFYGVTEVVIVDEVRTTYDVFKFLSLSNQKLILPCTP